MYRSLIAVLIAGIVNVALPAPARASTAEEAARRADVASIAGLPAPGALQRSIAAEARRAALQAPEDGAAAPGGSHVACRTGAVLLAGAGAAFATAVVKHANWTGSGETTTPGAKPPSSVGVSVSIGAVLAGVGIFAMSRSCGQ